MPKISSSTSKNKLLDSALANIPGDFRKRIVESYLEIKNRFSKSLYSAEYDTAGLSVGKFTETVLRFVQQEVSGTHTKFGVHIPSFPDECRKIITAKNNSVHESVRIIIPRALVFLYTMRGKRGIGHTGGDVEANVIDLKTITRVADWIICELIRIYHNLSLEEAQEVVDALSAKELPVIWEVAGKKRVLNKTLSAKERTLLLAYTDVKSGILTEDLFSWAEYSSLGDFKRKVIKPLHKEKMIEYDEDSEIVFLSPIGIEEVESRLMKISLQNNE
ncbi:MAG: hypothetical protein WA666_04090 [Nitrospirota bacterium]